MSETVEHHTGTLAVSEGQMRIVRESLPLFIERGYRGVSMQQIADAAQIHKATLYHHFRDKDEIFSTVVLYVFDLFRMEMEQAIAAGGSVREQLVQIACQMFRRTESEFSRLMTDLHENIPQDQRNELIRQGGFPWDLMEQLVCRAVDEGEIPDIESDLVISMFIGQVSGQIWMRKIEHTDAPLTEELARILVDALFAGLQTVPLSNQT